MGWKFQFFDFLSNYWEFNEKNVLKLFRSFFDFLKVWKLKIDSRICCGKKSSFEKVSTGLFLFHIFHFCWIICSTYSCGYLGAQIDSEERVFF